MAMLSFALRGAGPSLDRKLWEVQRFPEMETWYEEIIWIKKICLWTDEEPFCQPHQKMNSPFMGLAWVLWVIHRLPSTPSFSSQRANIYWWNKLELERSVFVTETGFKKLGLSSLKLETVLSDSNAQPKPVITNHIASLNIYRKQTRL